MIAALCGVLLLTPLTARGQSEVVALIPLDKLVPPPKVVTWDEIIAPQLAARDAQNEAKKEAAAQAAKLAAQHAATLAAQRAVQTNPLPTNAAKAFIYSHESGNRTGAINASSGACGLGQALPCSKMPCSLIDYACQDNYFTNYMLARYGSWENAYLFWVAHRWW